MDNDMASAEVVHTPGPWGAVSFPFLAEITAADGTLLALPLADNHYGQTWTINPDICRLCDVDQAIANATLMAAAPDLLEALELADATLRGANMNRDVVERKVSAALDKARGK